MSISKRAWTTAGCLAYLAAHGEVLSQRYQDNRVTVHCRLSLSHLGRIHETDTVVRLHTNGAVVGNGNGYSAVNGFVEDSAEGIDRSRSQVSTAILADGVAEC